jgi:integrase
MSVYARPDSPYWWMYLETTQQKVRTKYLVGLTTQQRRASRALAEAFYHQQMNATAARIDKLPLDRPVMRFGAWAKLYARDVLPQHRGAEREREILRVLNRGLGDELLHQLTRDRVDQWRTERLQQVSANTVNREIDLLKSMLKRAVPTYLESSPLAGMKRLATVRPKRHLMTPDEEKRILRYLAPDDSAILLIGLDALVRLGDILDLRWADDHGTTLYIRDPKDRTTPRPYTVPVSARVREALDALGKTGEYIFARRRQAAPGHRGAVVRAALKIACRDAKIPYGRKKEGVTFHWGTRRTGATRMLQRGAELKAVQAIGNWKHPTVMLDIYAESTSAAAFAAVELVADPAKKRA